MNASKLLKETLRKYKWIAVNGNDRYNDRVTAFFTKKPKLRNSDSGNIYVYADDDNDTAFMLPVDLCKPGTCKRISWKQILKDDE